MKPLSNKSLNIKFTSEQHALLKSLSAQKGMTMRQFIVESMLEKIERQKEYKEEEITEDQFKKSLEKVIKQNRNLLKKLSKM